MSTSSAENACETTPEAGDAPKRRHPARSVINWVLAILTAPGAAVVVAAAYIHVLGSAGCSPDACGRLGPGPVLFAVITDGAPVVAVAAIALSFVTARHRFGIAVPVIAWILLAAGLIALDVSFQTP